MIKRHEDWAERLADAVSEANRKMFAWGSFDCALFACDAVKAMTGRDHGEPFRGKYNSQFGAIRTLREQSGGDLLAMATKALGTPRTNIGHAQRGDVVYVDEGPTLAVVIDGRTIAAPFEGGGLSTKPLMVARYYWVI